MYQPHPYYEPQVAALQDTPLWRYMSLGELLGLLTHGRLWLSCIAEMEDKQEGLFFDDSTHDRQLLGIAKRLRYECFVSCWSALYDESLEMWKSYTDSSGIAIKSDIWALRKSLGHQDYDNVFLGLVKYDSNPVDLHSLHEGGTTLTDAFFYKRQAFSYEREVRLVSLQAMMMPRLENLNATPTHRTLGVQVNLTDLIHEIRISPYADIWFRSAVARLVERFDLRSELVKVSTLREAFAPAPSQPDVPTFRYGPPSHQERVHQAGTYEKTKDESGYSYRRIEWL